MDYIYLYMSDHNNYYYNFIILFSNKYQFRLTDRVKHRTSFIYIDLKKKIIDIVDDIAENHFEKYHHIPIITSKTLDYIFTVYDNILDFNPINYKPKILFKLPYEYDNLKENMDLYYNLNKKSIPIFNIQELNIIIDGK